MYVCTDSAPLCVLNMGIPAALCGGLVYISPNIFLLTTKELVCFNLIGSVGVQCLKLDQEQGSFLHVYLPINHGQYPAMHRSSGLQLTRESYFRSYQEISKVKTRLQ